MSRAIDAPRSTGDLTGKVVAVTGGARGIGLAAVDAFLAAGAFVVLGDLDATLAGDVAVARGGRALGMALDVTDAASFGAFLDAATKGFGALDVLVNNAGVTPTGSLLDEPQALTYRIVAVNLVGVITGCRLAGARMRDQVRGRRIHRGPAEGTRSAWRPRRRRPASGREHRTIRGANYPRWMKPVLDIEPDDVATAVLKVASTRGPAQTVPRRLGLPVRVSQLLPTVVRCYL